jgi:hypothetical protein
LLCVAASPDGSRIYAVVIYSCLSGSATNGPIVLSMNDFTVTPLP